MKTRIEKLQAALAELQSEIPERAHEVAIHARKHPLPYAITGLGLALTLGQAIRIALRKPEPPRPLRRRVVRAAETARHRVTEFAQTAAGVAATGFLAGLLLPPTRNEKERFDDSTRRLIDELKEAGHDAIEEGKAAVKEMLAAADSAVREAAEEDGDILRSKLDGADEAVREATNEADQTVSNAARKIGEAFRDAAQEATRSIKKTVEQAVKQA